MRAAMRSTRPLCCVSARVLRAYIYNALFTTAKPPKIRVSRSFSLFLLLPLLRTSYPSPFPFPTLLYCSPVPPLHTITCYPLAWVSSFSVSFFHSVMDSWFLLYERRSWPTQYCVASPHFLFRFCSFYPRPFFAPSCSRIKFALLFYYCNRYIRKRIRWLSLNRDLSMLYFPDVPILITRTNHRTNSVSDRYLLMWKLKLKTFSLRYGKQCNNQSNIVMQYHLENK